MELYNFEKLQEKTKVRVKILYVKYVNGGRVYDLETFEMTPKIAKYIKTYEHNWSSPQNISTWIRDDKNCRWRMSTRFGRNIYDEEVLDKVVGPVFTSLILKSGEIINIPSPPAEIDKSIHLEPAAESPRSENEGFSMDSGICADTTPPPDEIPHVKLESIPNRKFGGIFSCFDNSEIRN